MIKPSIRLASLLPDGEIDFVYDIDEALEGVGAEDYDRLVPVVIFRHHELHSYMNPLSIAHIKLDLEKVVVRGL